MKAHIMFTALNQSWPVYFILFHLLFCKITHACNFIFSLNFFINQVIDIFTTPFFLQCQRYKLIFKSVLFALSFSCVFVTETSALFHVSTLISTILYIHNKRHNFFLWLFFIFSFFLFFLFFLNYIKCLIIFDYFLQVKSLTHSLIFIFSNQI